MTANQPKTKEKQRPFLFPEFCKGCGRCIEACSKNCISVGTEINSLTGLIPIKMDLDSCIGCGLCVSACPEPYALGMHDANNSIGDKSREAGVLPSSSDLEEIFGSRSDAKACTENILDQILPLPPTRPQVIKGTYASAVGAILAGCRHFYGYPITPSTEGAELMAKLQPKLDGVFFQAVSEVATVNLMYGTGGAGLPCMTFTSSPGFSLMLEGISYMIGSEIPGVFVNIMRGGPGLGNIAPEQSDIKLVCQGLGHGNTYAIVLAPATPQEMLDLTILAFDLSFKYRNPVIVAADGYLGQMTGKVVLPNNIKKPGMPAWAVYGDQKHRGNFLSSIYLTEKDLEDHNIKLNKKYQKMTDNEQRADLFHCDDAEVVIVACNTPAQTVKGAIASLREKGIKVGLFRPITLWPFPVNQMKPLLEKAKHLVVVEASTGQLENEMISALSKVGFSKFPPISNVQRFGGILPGQAEIIEKVLSLDLTAKK